MPSPILIATRKSPLALKQTEMVRAWLGQKLPASQFEELRLNTNVDQRLSWSLEKRGGIGLFTKELEDALLENRAQIAVHSAKDMPTTQQAEIPIAGYLPRARANDVLVHRADCSAPTSIATSSPRRRAQVQLAHPQADWTTIRGNVATRMQKIVDGEADATLLAAAGLDRLEITEHEGLCFVEQPIDEVVPAPGQAAIAIQCRAEFLEQFQDLFCEQTKLAVELERSFLHKLGGGCQTPVGAHYTNGTFYIFHPEVGYTTFEFELETLNEIDPVLDSILKELSLT
ncbi:MAG: hydroxymethylbilane synthase [Lentimonas sp.]